MYVYRVRAANRIKPDFQKSEKGHTLGLTNYATLQGEERYVEVWKLKKNYEYRVSVRKIGKPGGKVYTYTDLHKVLSIVRQYEKAGYIVHLMEREVGKWEEVRNACDDDD